jgi:hypothetical protein
MKILSIESSSVFCFSSWIVTPRPASNNTFFDPTSIKIAVVAGPCGSKMGVPVPNRNNFIAKLKAEYLHGSKAA